MSEYREYMTNGMLEVYDGFTDKMEKECLFCLKELKKAKKEGNISLPHINERGIKVKHGSRLEIKKITTYWERRLILAMDFVSREFQEEHGLLEELS